jgi:hypothetical protein
MITKTIASGFAFLVMGCEVPAPTIDTTPPEVTVTVSRARGPNVFRSIDGELGAKENCIKVPEMPTQLILIAGDAGGVDFATIAAVGTIIPESVEFTPRPPEGSSSIRTGTTQSLIITLTPPSPSTVRTGATAILEVDGRLPMPITASVRDRAGTLVQLPQFDLRSLEDAVQCRGR